MQYLAIIALSVIYLCLPIDWDMFVRGGWALGFFLVFLWYAALIVVVLAILAVIGLVMMSLTT